MKLVVETISLKKFEKNLFSEKLTLSKIVDNSIPSTLLIRFYSIL